MLLPNAGANRFLKNNRLQSPRKTLALVLACVAFLAVLAMDSHDPTRHLLVSAYGSVYFGSSLSPEIPKKVHFVVMGSEPPAHILNIMDYSRKHLQEIHPDYEVKVWRDEDAEQLVQDQNDARLTKAWEYIKADEQIGRYAKRADFIRTLIMYVEGGVYLDTDMVPCDGIDFMTETPGVVSFPFIPAFHVEVNAAAFSAPQGHRMQRMALESFKAKGEMLKDMDNLRAAGPSAMALVADEYFKTIRIQQQYPNEFRKLPRFVYKKNDRYDLPDMPGITDKSHDYWTTLADFQYAPEGNSKGLHHMETKTWRHFQLQEDYVEPECAKDPSKIKPWLNYVCSSEHHHEIFRFESCGVDN